MNIITESIGGLTYGGVFILALLSNLFIPVPEEIVLLAMGYLTGIGIFAYPIVMAVFIVGMLISDYLLYSLSKKGSRLTIKLQKRLEKRGILKNKNFVGKNINKIIFFSRFLIYLRFIGPVLSGAVGVERKRFLKLDFLALVIYVNLFLGLGNYFHKQLIIITDGVAKFKNYLLFFLAIVVSIFILRYIQKNFMKWIKAIGVYIPTIIPGLEKKEDEILDEDK
ncbi:MAG: VTT domain-containing protein [Candidatus Paceibacterota bacterium]